MTEIRDLGIADFARMFGVDAEAIPDSSRRLIEELEFRHRVLTGGEREAQMLRAVKALNADLPVSGRHRQTRWESGWRENLDEFIAAGYDTDTLIPKFVKVGEVIRLDGNYIAPLSDTFETNYVKVLRDFLFSTYFTGLQAVYEFGCGTGHNLVQLGRSFPGIRLMGMDWTQSTLEILDLLRAHKGLDIGGHLFDIFTPDESIVLPPRTGVFTIGTLEQIGTEHERFIRFLLERRPEVVIHVETLYELYDQNDLFDYVAAAYLEKRGYLRGLIPLLRRLEAEGVIEILKLQRTFGSFFHDGYSFVAWRPKPTAT